MTVRGSTALRSTPVSESVEHVRRTLTAGGFDASIRVFDTPVPSAAAAAERLGCEVGAIANSLVFRADDAVVLVLVSGAHRVDTGRVAAHLGVAKGRVRSADPELVHTVTGQHVGGVAPIGHPRPLPTLVDRALAAHDVVWAGAGDEHSMFATTTGDLVAMTAGTVLDLART